MSSETPTSVTIETPVSRSLAVVGPTSPISTISTCSTASSSSPVSTGNSQFDTSPSEVSSSVKTLSLSDGDPKIKSSLSQANAMAEHDPALWVELVEPQTQQTYYYHKTLKKMQMERPKCYLLDEKTTCKKKNLSGDEVVLKRVPIRTTVTEDKREETWEDLVTETAALRARLTVVGAVPLGKQMEIQKDHISSLTTSPLAKKRERGTTLIETKLINMLGLLTTGDTFKKYKYNKASVRLIWCTPLLDYVLWGEKDRTRVKGRISTATLTEVKYNEKEKKIILITPKRTLELEAKSSDHAATWIEAFNFLIRSQQCERQARSELEETEGFKNELTKCRHEHKKILVEGDVFKKWPSRKSVQTGSETIRRLWCDENLQKLFWTQLTTGVQKGFIDLEQIVHVIENTKDPLDLKFTIIGVKRSLDLEAKSSTTRQHWVRALRFFIYERKREADILETST